MIFIINKDYIHYLTKLIKKLLIKLFDLFNHKFIMCYHLIIKIIVYRAFLCFHYPLLKLVMILSLNFVNLLIFNLLEFQTPLLYIKIYNN